MLLERERAPKTAREEAQSQLEAARAAAVERMLAALEGEAENRRRQARLRLTPEECRADSYRARVGAARATYALASLEAGQHIKRVGPGAYLMRRRYFAGE
jgi:hypothetical protein